jgi:hypothetical protein
MSELDQYSMQFNTPDRPNDPSWHIFALQAADSGACE